MARFPSIDAQGAFESPQVQNSVKELVTGSTDGITVDTSVGTRVYVGDTMIHGDTGWRRVDALLDDTVITDQLAVYIKRENSTVWLSFDVFRVAEEIPADATLFNIPQGFEPQRPVRSGSGATYELRSALYTSGNSLKVRDDVVAGNRRFYTSWSANSAWPTSEPGTPA